LRLDPTSNPLSEEELRAGASELLNEMGYGEGGFQACLARFGTEVGLGRESALNDELLVLMRVFLRSGHQSRLGEAFDGQAKSKRPALPEEGLFLRLDPGMHTAAIIRMSVSGDGRLVATASHDKTVRLWALPEGRPIRTLRPPVGEGDEGKLYAVALSPDGRWLAAGGWITDNTNTVAWVHIFETATGALTTRLGPLPNVVLDLEVSPDGTRLAAGLGGANGIRLWQVDTGSPSLAGEEPAESGNSGTAGVNLSNGNPGRAPRFTALPADSAYGDDVYGLAFAPDGRLFTTSYVGQIRAYAAGLYNRPARKARAPGGDRPFGLDLSPDGARLAVGYEDTIRVSLLDPETLDPMGEADTSGLSNGTLHSVAWLADGATGRAGGPEPGNLAATQKKRRGPERHSV